MQKRPLALLLFLIFVFLNSSANAKIVNDVSRINPVNIEKQINVSSVDEIINAVNYAKTNNLKISISGKNNSQGAHTANKGGLVINLSEYNKIISLSQEQKTIIVESGATWANIQAHINKYGLSIAVMQSSNIFTIGGSLSSNIHGRDPNYGTIVEVVKSFKIVIADGSHIKISRDINPELFYSVIGGYGLLGVITEVELIITDNYLLRKNVTELIYSDYVDHLNNSIKNNINLHYARCSIVKNKDFFHKCVAVDYVTDGNITSKESLVDEKYVSRDKYFFDLSRKFDWGKDLRWSLQELLIDSPRKQEIVSRNNAMRPSISFIDYYSKKDTDILQEYFIPKEALTEYLYQLRNLIIVNKVNLLSMTMRFIPKSEEIYLNYAQTDLVAVVLYMNIDLDKDGIIKARNWTQSMVDLAQEYEGKYYLTYQRFPTIEQFRKSYPKWQKFKNIKDKYDQDGIFTNEFYKKYFLL